jgi:hypothetical protein
VQQRVACEKSRSALQYTQEVTAMDTKEILLKLRTKSGFSQDEQDRLFLVGKTATQFRIRKH